MRAVPRLCKFYPGICFTTEEKAWKNLSQCKKNLRLRKTSVRVQYIYYQCKWSRRTKSIINFSVKPQEGSESVWPGCFNSHCYKTVKGNIHSLYNAVSLTPHYQSGSEVPRYPFELPSFVQRCRRHWMDLSQSSVLAPLPTQPLMLLGRSLSQYAFER